MHCKSCDFKKHCNVYSDFFINFMVHNMFCNLAAVVPFLLFLFLSLCFNKYIFYGTTGKPTQCLMYLTGVAVGVSKTRMQISAAALFSGVFLFTKEHKNTIYLHILCLLFQLPLFYSPSTLVLWFRPWHLCLLVMLAGKKMDLVALKVRHIRN